MVSGGGNELSIGPAIQIDEGMREMCLGQVAVICLNFARNLSIYPGIDISKMRWR